MTRTIHASLGFFMLLWASTPVSAFPVVTEWKVRVESGFVTTASTAEGPVTGLASGLSGSDPSPEPTLGGAPATLSWGSGSEISSLSVGGPTGGHHVTTMFTNGELVETVKIEFVNRQSQGPALVYGGLMDGVWSDAIAPSFYEQGIPGTGENHLPLFWNIYYVDTPDSGTCLLPGPTPCSDMAVVEPVGMAYVDSYDAFVGQFDFFGHRYTSFMQIEGLSSLNDQLCTAIGKTGGCLGILLPENTVTSLQVRVGITVPEPPTAAILLLAFCMAAIIRTRATRSPG